MLILQQPVQVQGVALAESPLEQALRPLQQVQSLPALQPQAVLVLVLQQLVVPLWLRLQPVRRTVFSASILPEPELS